MKNQRIINKILIYIALSLMLIFVLFPFLLLLINAFKTNGEIINSPLAMPKSISFENFKIAMEAMNYYGSFMNSLLITLVSLSLILLTSSMAAHYFVRNKTKFSKIMFFSMVASMIIPFQAIMIPLVSIYGQKLGWIQADPKSTLIFMYVGFGGPLAVFIYHGFIKSIPVELEEAAEIDGCTKRQVFFRIVFPMLKPTTVTIGILNVLWIWNDYLLPALILQNGGPENYTLPLSIRVFQGTFTSNYEKFLPAVLLVIIPVLIVYLFMQQYIIEGVTQGAIK